MVDSLGVNLLVFGVNKGETVLMGVERPLGLLIGHAYGVQGQTMVDINNALCDLARQNAERNKK